MVLSPFARAELAVLRASGPERPETGRGSRGGISRSPTYSSWYSMVSRCTRTEHPEYARYGGCGIKVCARWLQFENFLADMGERPRGKTIDRFPNGRGDYEPGNCRWATPSEQSRNLSSNIRVTVGMKTACVAEHAEDAGLGAEMVRDRLRHGQRIDEALRPSARHKQLFRGEMMTIRQIARAVGIPAATLAWRLSRGWPLENATTVPVNGHRVVTAVDAESISREYAAGLSQAEIARRRELKPSVINKIVRGKTWQAHATRCS